MIYNYVWFYLTTLKNIELFTYVSIIYLILQHNQLVCSEANKTYFIITVETMSGTSKTPRVLSIQSHVVHGYVGNKSATFPLQVCTMLFILLP